MDRLPRKPRKSYNAPFWVMLFVSLILILGCIGVYITQQRINAANSQRQINYNGWLILWSALFLAETIMYRIMRKNIGKKMYVWLHICAVSFSFIVLPLLAVIISVNITTRKNIATMDLVRQAERVLFWASFIIGHAFFIATIVKSFTKTKGIIEGDEAAPGILDGILDEY